MMDGSINQSELDSESFRAIADLAYKESGLQLVIEKSSMIQSRLRHRLGAVGLSNFSKYASFVCSEEGEQERKLMISALTTNVSHFFRENHHFEILRDTIFPKLLHSLKKEGRLRIWSAGCSNGQEAYSILMTLFEAYPQLDQLDVKVLATDIDPKVVTFAKAGIFPERLVSGVPQELLKKYFIHSSGSDGGIYQVNERVRSKVFFSELNLLSPWPINNQMDVIFCRNVVIYFDQVTQNSLWPRFHEKLTADGYLFLGHSERIADPGSMGFSTQGPTMYRPLTASFPQ